MTSAPIRIVLVDDHLCVLELLAACINAAPDLEVAATATDADEGLRRILEQKPDIALLDVSLPGRGAFDVAQELVVRQRATKIAFFTGFVSDLFLSQALRLGARGYLVKGEPIQTLLDGLRRIAAGEMVFSAEVRHRLDFDPRRRRFAVRTETRLAALTPRQLEVMRHLAHGRSVKEVARLMHLSEKSVDSHKHRIMTKLDIHDRVELARFAIREGLTQP